MIREPAESQSRLSADRAPSDRADRRDGVLRIVTQRQIRHLIESAGPTLLFGMLVACVVFFAVWRTTGSDTIALWLSGIVVVTAVRLLALGPLKHYLGDSDAARSAGHIYALSAFLAGLAWAWIAAFDDPSLPVGARLMVLVTLVAMPVASLSSNAIYLPVFYAFSLPVFVAMFWWSWQLIPEMAAEFSLLAAAYGALVAVMANRYNRNLKRSLLRDIENEMLLHEVHAMNDELQRMAYQDPLTGLSNRRSFEETTTQLLQRRRANDRLALMLIDMDKFKAINDNHGHAAGDAALIELSRRIERNSRISEVVAQTQVGAARIGGDEFIVVYRLDSETAIEPLATRILDALMVPMTFENEKFQPGVSIGIAISPTHANDLEGSLRAADSAMYVAKSNGGGRYVVADGDSAAPDQVSDATG